MKFYQVDAFTQKPYEGNPCAVFPDARGLSEGQMLSITREMNLSETAFLTPSKEADVRARYFTPMGEIPLAGHPTMASVHVMLELTMALTAGTIIVRVSMREGQPWITMRQLQPRFGRTYSAGEVAPLFNLDPSSLRSDVPVQTVSTGTPQLMVPLNDESALNRARVALDEYRTLAARGDFYSPHLFVLYEDGDAVSTRARHFGGVSESSEDPFTGSATGGMGAYLYRYGLLPGGEFTALQGANLYRPGIALCRVIPDTSAPEGIGAVEITGTAVSVFTGELVVLPE